MEHQNLRLLNDSTISMFVTWKSIEVYDLSKCKYSINKNSRFKTPVLRSD